MQFLKFGDHFKNGTPNHNILNCQIERLSKGKLESSFEMSLNEQCSLTHANVIGDMRKREMVYIDSYVRNRHYSASLSKILR